MHWNNLQLVWAQRFAKPQSAQIPQRFAFDAIRT
jgi:hypothetical protein